jgi:hypothetical protein
VQRLLRTYKSLPGEFTDPYIEYLAEATGSGRCNGRSRHMWLTWDMLRDMKKQGMTIGGHTVNHPILSRLPREQQLEEIAGCGRRLREELGEPMRWFSYPRGKPDSFNDETRACLREAGVELAFSAYGGVRTALDWDPLDVRRSGVEMYNNPSRLRAMAMLPQVFA